MPILCRRALFVVCSIVLLGAPTESFAQTSDESSAKHLQAYCDWRGAQANAEQTMLWAPDVVAWSWGGGLYDSSAMDDSSALRGRILAGLRYDFSDLYRGFLRGDEATAACQRYRAKSRFERAVGRSAQIGQRAALEAKYKVLSDAVPQAKEVVKGLKRAVKGKRASDRELRAMQIRLETLERMAQESRDELAGLGDAGEKTPNLYDLLDAYMRADRAYQQARAQTERSKSWELSLAAGYQHRFGVQESAPVFAGAALSFNIGRLWEASATERAIEAHQTWQKQRPGGPAGKLRQVVRTHKLSARADQEQLQTKAQLLADLEARLERLAPLKGQDAVSYRNLVWFDYAQLIAETTALSMRLERTRAFLKRVESMEGAREEDAQQDEESTYVTRTFALRYQPTPLSEVKKPATPLEQLKKLKQYDPKSFDMIIGQVEPQKGKSLDFGIQVPKSRIYFPGSDGRLGRIKFTYDGHSEETADFASGRSRAQIGLKLRAQDSCNVLYVMWRIDPEQRIMVSSKSNPDDHLNRQCGNAGYANLRPTEVTHPPLVKPGEPHTLGAHLEDGILQVFVDEKLVWKGDVGTLGYEGVTGLRSDNGFFSDVAIFTRPRK